jgi:hypothetical protein
VKIGDKDGGRLPHEERNQTDSEITKLQFAIIGSYTPMARLSLGVGLVTDKEGSVDNFIRQFRVLSEYTSFSQFRADSEFTMRDAIEAARSAVGKRWIIRAKNTGNVKKFKRTLTPDEPKSKRDIKIKDTYTNIFAHPTKGNKHMILLSDLSPQNHTPADMYSSYLERWNIEIIIRQLKHDLLPKMKSSSRYVWLFLLNVSSIFYNMYKIANQAVSPKYGLPLRPTHYEVLRGIIEAEFDRSSPLQPH